MLGRASCVCATFVSTSRCSRPVLGEADFTGSPKCRHSWADRPRSGYCRAVARSSIRKTAARRDYSLGGGMGHLSCCEGFNWPRAAIFRPCKTLRGPRDPRSFAGTLGSMAGRALNNASDRRYTVETVRKRSSVDSWTRYLFGGWVHRAAPPAPFDRPRCVRAGPGMRHSCNDILQGRHPNDVQALRNLVAVDGRGGYLRD